MPNSVRDQIHRFFQWYEDLYGKDYYIDPDSLENIHSPDKPTEKQFRLAEFRRSIENCTKCPLHRTRTRFVFGAGNPDAKIMFIGEAPGRDEDLQGEPFVGQAGQLLNKLLAHIHLNRTEVYIANILKSRPPNNREPLPEEVAQCIPYLHRQIEIIQPKLLVALGRVAAQNLLNTTDSLSNLRSRMWAYQEIPLIVTYHPAALLRNESLYEPTLKDFEMILERARNL